MNLQLYTSADAGAWNAFSAKCKNGTFLFHRDYIDYHRERLADASLLVHDDRGTLVAVFPANRRDRTVVSHGALTYENAASPLAS
jgi:hypothetical protein